MLDRRRSKCLELESLPIFLPERQGWGVAESRCNGHARLRQMGGSKWPQILLTEQISLLPPLGHLSPVSKSGLPRGRRSPEILRHARGVAPGRKPDHQIGQE